MDSSIRSKSDKPTRAGSLDYKTAGRVARGAIERAMSADLSALEFRVFNAVLHRTVSYSKAADQTSSRELASIVYSVDRDEVSGWQRRKISNALVSLRDAQIIDYKPSAGPGARMLVSVDKGVQDETPKGVQDETPLDGKVSRIGAKGVQDWRERCLPVAAPPSNRTRNTEEREASGGGSAHAPHAASLSSQELEESERLDAFVAEHGDDWESWPLKVRIAYWKEFPEYATDTLSGHGYEIARDHWHRQNANITDDEIDGFVDEFREACEMGESADQYLVDLLRGTNYPSKAREKMEKLLKSWEIEEKDELRDRRERRAAGPCAGCVGGWLPGICVGDDAHRCACNPEKGGFSRDPSSDPDNLTVGMELHIGGQFHKWDGRQWIAQESREQVIARQREFERGQQEIAKMAAPLIDAGVPAELAREQAREEYVALKGHQIGGTK